MAANIYGDITFDEATNGPMERPRETLEE